MGVPVPGVKKVNVMIQRLRASAEDRLDRHRELFEKGGADSKPTLFTKLHAAGEENLSKEELCSNAQVYISAGSDTTSNTLTYLVWFLCRSPEMKHKLLEELRGLPQPLDYEDLRDLPYLNGVIKETLRMYPSIPSTLMRRVPEGGAELAGYWFEGGTAVSTQAWSLHRDASVYAEPEKFDPLRWNNPTKAMKDAFMTFGAGSRSECCL
jgi:cytochrome P450